MFLPGLEPGTFRVLGERDDHYTTETTAWQGPEVTAHMIQRDMSLSSMGVQ